MMAVEAEATGQPAITATYNGREYKLAADADDWPLEAIAVSVGVNNAGRLVTIHNTAARALAALLGDQWPDFLQRFPQRRHLQAASSAFAAAAGFTAAPADLAFGPLPRLLATLQLWPDAAEATLTAAGFDYRDRWRFDPDGRRRLTLRQINVALSCASPADSPLAIAQNDNRLPLTSTDVLLMDVYEAITRTAHPSRPMTPDQREKRLTVQEKTDKAIEDYRRRHPSSGARKRSAVETAKANATNPKGSTDAPQPQKET
jgi:hypothetical protein